MRSPLMRIPFTGPLPQPRIIPRNASTPSGAIAALTSFITSHNGDAPCNENRGCTANTAGTLILSGAGISVASGLADYRGTQGTYTLNRTYRPIYYNEFLSSHEARKRYWARSFLGWTTLDRARPNAAHWAVGRLGEMEIVGKVVTQNVDSFHPIAHPSLPTIELHGYLRSLTCLSCHTPLPRADFQTALSTLNPAWAAFLEEVLTSGALDTENPTERQIRGIKTNPDGDVDLPGAPYSTFRYPACPQCLVAPPTGIDGKPTHVHVDLDGAWLDSSTAGVLKPSVVMFGESISEAVKKAAEQAVDSASRLLVVGSSLATYSAFRLARRAKERGMPIGVLNLGGVRGEDGFFDGGRGVRIDMDADKVLLGVVERLERLGLRSTRGK
ncbi:MAG: hypothetical protein M1840_000854 [Geoglossum simile]|nr:MAG: hypothetical protein M1840_000854 [Geoglossum simile]